MPFKESDIMKPFFIRIHPLNIWAFSLFMLNIVIIVLLCIPFVSVSYASINMEPYYEADFKDGNTWTIRENGVTYSETVLPETVYVNGVATKVLLQTGGEDSGSKTYQSMDDTGLYLHRFYIPNMYLPEAGFVNATITFIPPLKGSHKIGDIGQLFQSTGTAHYVVTESTTIPSDLNYGHQVKSVGNENVATGSTNITFDVSYDYNIKAVGYENVTVPFGNFYALKAQRFLEMSGWVEGEYFSSSATSTVWLIPHLGSIKEDSLDDQGERDIYELVDTNIPFDQIDSDSDNYPNGQDAFPHDPNEWIDTDSDGTGNNADSDDDGDGMPDVWEDAYNFNSLVNNASDDPDGDELSNLQEYQNNTNPINSDTDGDGLKDKWEIIYGFNPVNTDESGQDPDNDGLKNIEEQNHGTKPWSADSDGDGCNDGSEVTGGRNPNKQDPQGDLNTDCALDIEDTIIALQIMAGIGSSSSIDLDADVNGNNKIGMEELVYILQKISDLR